MNREEVRQICKRVNKGEKLSDISEELNVKECYIKSLINEYGYVYSSVLKKFYNSDMKDEVLEAEKDIKKYEIMDNIEKLWLKRYQGLDAENYDGVLEEWADYPREELKIHLNIDLYGELIEEANELELDISFLIEQGMLEMLERNRETRDKKMKINYLKHICENLFSASFTEEEREKLTYEERLSKSIEQEREFLEEIKSNVKRKDFLVEPFNYNNIDEDTEIYAESYLLDNGYTEDNIEEIYEEEEMYKLDDEAIIEHYHMKRRNINMDYINIRKKLLED